jgi:hypothetical protein
LESGDLLSLSLILFARKTVVPATIRVRSNFGQYSDCEANESQNFKRFFSWILIPTHDMRNYIEDYERSEKD